MRLPLPDFCFLFSFLASHVLRVLDLVDSVVLWCTWHACYLLQCRHVMYSNCWILSSILRTVWGFKLSYMRCTFMASSDSGAMWPGCCSISFIQFSVFQVEFVPFQNHSMLLQTRVWVFLAVQFYHEWVYPRFRCYECRSFSLLSLPVVFCTSGVVGRNSLFRVLRFDSLVRRGATFFVNTTKPRFWLFCVESVVPSTWHDS